MNNIFQKNIQALLQKNKTLANKLLTFIPSDLPELVQENNSYNLKYKDVYLHNKQNPAGEAGEVFSMAENSPVAIHLIYGMGLGYLFQTASVNSKGTVILFEKDLNILWTAFTLVDFSGDIVKKNVNIVDNYDDAVSIIYKNSNTVNSPQILSLPSARELNAGEFDELVKKLQDVVGSFGLDLKYTKEKFYPSLLMLTENIPNLLNEIPLAKFKNVYEGKTAVVVSAGPSLDRDIEIIKKYRDKFILLTVGTAAKTLYKNGIKPDYICIIETYNASKQLEGLDLSDVYFITEPYSNPALRKFKFKKILSHISANSPINLFWAELCGENAEEYWSKGTVSYMAMNCARILGCKKIILSGQDLAYAGGQCYSKDSAYKDLVCEYNDKNKKWEITAKNLDEFANAISASNDMGERRNTAKSRLARLNNSLYYVKGINGEMLPTESVYAAFVKPIEEFAAHFKGIEYVNASLIGAQIDGFENIPLEEALKDLSPVMNKELAGDFLYDKKYIKDKILEKTEELNSAMSMINEAKRFAKNLNNELKRKRTIDAEVLKILRKLSEYYLKLSGEIAEKSRLFDIITVNDKIDIDYEMKMITDFNLDNVSRICGKLMQYLNNAETKSAEIKQKLNGVINENFITES